MKIWFIVIFFVVLVVAGYLSISLLNGVNADGVLEVSKIQTNISMWNPYLIHFYISSVITAPVILTGIVIEKKALKAMDFKFAAAINVKEYKKKTRFDSLMAHYTNVATVGLLISLAFYSSYALLNSNGWRYVGVLFLLALSFLLYSIIFAKIGYYIFAKNKPKFVLTWDRMPCAAAVLALDFWIISMFLEVSLKSVEQL